MKIPTFFIRILYILVLVLLTMNLFAKNYYVNSLSTSSIADGSFLNPWKTTADVNNGNYLLIPGDTVFFKRGGLYSGTLYCNKSGTAALPIVYTAYGIGNMPELTHTTTNVIVIYARQFIVIDGLKIIDKTMPPTDHSIIAKIGYGIIINNAPFNKVKNCDISLVGIGIEVADGANFTELTNNYIHDLRMIKNTNDGGEDDFGANAVLLGSFSNKILNNKFERCWGYSYDFGRDGGAIEFFNTNMNENVIMYNVANECVGFLEIASFNNSYAINNLIAYNKIINCGPIGVYHNAAGVEVKVYNTQYFNNTIICTNKDFVYGSILFWMSDNTEIDVINFRNNIVWLTTGFSFLNNNLYPDRIVHKNNIYHITDGGVLGTVLDPTEILNGYEQLFVDTTSPDPMNWDIHLRPNSEAVNFGVNVGLLRDFAGTVLTDNKPDAGVYEYVFPEPTELVAAVSLDSLIKCYGDSTTVTVVAVGGTKPYTNVGVFKVGAGIYRHVVTDALGVKDTVYITVVQPDKLDLNTSISAIIPGQQFVTLTAVASGGTIPYLYKLDGGIYQSSGIFNNVYQGTYNMSVKDAKACVLTKPINVIIPTNNPPVASIVGVPIICNGDITTVTVSATNGTPPYIGTGTFYVVAGTYGYIVTDSQGLKDTVSITLSEPPPISVSLSAGTTPTSSDTTRITAIASGGTSPYLYNINGGVFQTSNIFYNIYPGNYEVGVKDVNACLETKSIAIIITVINPVLTSKFKISVYPNPSSTTFTLAPIKYRGTFYPLKIRVYNSFGAIVYYKEGMSNVSYTFGANFLPGLYTLMVELDKSFQAVQLIKL